MEAAGGVEALTEAAEEAKVEEEEEMVERRSDANDVAADGHGIKANRPSTLQRAAATCLVARVEKKLLLPNAPA